MRIILSGGGTLGPVTPLLAIQEIIKKKYPETDFLWIGTKYGPEKELIQKQGIDFTFISSGKFRRYFSLFNLWDVGQVVIGFFQSIRIIWTFAPDICISAGGFVSVPLHWAAWLFGIPTWIHQQDARMGLANRLMAPFAKVVTSALAKKGKKIIWLGNPVRSDILSGDKDRARERFHLNPNLPVIFATGGGTGSLRVNQLLAEAAPHLNGIAQIIHLSGKERPQELTEKTEKQFAYYHHYQFFTDEMKDAYAVADIVVSRGGFGSLSEIAAWKKPAIIIPKPGHQEDNVAFLEKAGAVMLIDERTADGNALAHMIKELLTDNIKRKQMALSMQKLLPVAEEKDIEEIVEKLTK